MALQTKRLLYSLIFTVCLLSHMCELVAEIVEAASYMEIEGIFKDADAETLGVFAIDGVLTRSSDPAFQKGNWRENQQFVKCLLKKMTPQQRWLFVNFAAIQASYELIDPNEWIVLKRIQENKVKLIAFTVLMSGLLGDVYLQEWRSNQLKKLNIDFSVSFPAMPSFSMHNLCCSLGRSPVFFKGILSSNGDISSKTGECNQETVLVEFFRRVAWRPKKIIFVDERLSTLESIQAALLAFDPDIRFVGVHFTFVPNPRDISQDEFQSRWCRVFSLVNQFEGQLKPCGICP